MRSHYYFRYWLRWLLVCNVFHRRHLRPHPAGGRYCHKCTYLKYVWMTKGKAVKLRAKSKS